MAIPTGSVNAGSFIFDRLNNPTHLYVSRQAYFNISLQSYANSLQDTLDISTLLYYSLANSEIQADEGLAKVHIINTFFKSAGYIYLY